MGQLIINLINRFLMLIIIRVQQTVRYTFVANNDVFYLKAAVNCFCHFEEGEITLIAYGI